MDPRTDRAVGRVALAAAISLLLVVAATIVAVVSPSAREWTRERLRWAPGYQIGAPSGLPAAWLNTADRTVLIFASTSCEACRRSLPVYRTLVDAVRARSELRLRIMLTSPGDDEAAYAASIGAPAADVTRIDARGTRLRRVPTILIVDRQGLVVEKKEGVLSEGEQHALMETLKKLLPL